MSESRMDYGNTKIPSMHFNYLGLGSATLLQLAFLGESDPNFPWETFTLGQQSVKKLHSPQKNLLFWGHFFNGSFFSLCGLFLFVSLFGKFWRAVRAFCAVLKLETNTADAQLLRPICTWERLKHNTDKTHAEISSAGGEYIKKRSCKAIAVVTERHKP